MLNQKEQSNPAKRRREKQSNAKVRQLKVQYHCAAGSYEHVPKILLQGKWLREAGFSVSDEVAVTVMDHLLVIGKM